MQNKRGEKSYRTYSLTLVKLTHEQIAKAKVANGLRKRITHALICDPMDSGFGTENQCLKYWRVWDPDYRIEVSPGQFRSMFGTLFDKAVKTDSYDITDFESAPNLVMKLMDADDERQNKRARQRSPSHGM